MFSENFLFFYNNQSTEVLVCANQALCACQNECKLIKIKLIEGEILEIAE